jgi:hypothetical protein
MSAEIRPDFRQLLLDQRGAAVIIWSCFMISIVVYLVIAQHILANPRYGSGLSFAPTARIVVWILVIVDLAYIVWWKMRYLKPEAVLDRNKRSKLLNALDSHRGGMEQEAASVVSTFITRRITLYAIIEALAVYGLVLAVIGRYVTDQYLLSALSLVLLTIEFPTEKSLQNCLRQVEAPPS